MEKKKKKRRFTLRPRKIIGKKKTDRYMEKETMTLGLTLTNLAAEVIMLLPVAVLPVKTIW